MATILVTFHTASESITGALAWTREKKQSTIQGRGSTPWVTLSSGYRVAIILQDRGLIQEVLDDFVSLGRWVARRKTVKSFPFMPTEKSIYIRKGRFKICIESRIIPNHSMS